MADFLSALSSSRSRRTIKPKRVIPASHEGSDEEMRLSDATNPASAPPRLSRALFVVLITLIVGVVTIPLAYMPKALAISEWLRQTILFGVALVGLVATLVHIVRRKSLSLPRQWFTFALVGGVSLSAIVSALMSKTRYLSLYGYDGVEGYAATTYVAAAIVMILVAIIGHERRKLYYAWLTGGAVVMGLSVLSLYHVNVFPGVGISSWTPFGGTLALVVMAALTIVGSYGVLTEYRPSRALYAIAALAALCSFIVLISVNNRYGFLVLAGGSLVFLIGAAFRKEEILSRSMMAPCIGLFLSIVYLFMAIPSIVSTPLEVNISLKESVRVAGAALHANPVFGSGPGTYANQFLRLRGAEVTRQGFGNIDFHSGAGMVLTLLVTVGIFGGLLWTALVLWSLWMSGKGIVRDRRTGSYLAIQSVLFTVLVATLFLPVSPTILFTAVLFLGLSLAEGTYREISMARSERGIALRNGAVALVLLMLVIGTVVVVRRTGGVYFALRGARAFAQNAPTAIEAMTKAIVFDNGHDGYWRMLSDARRTQLNTASAQLGSGDVTPEAKTALQYMRAQMLDAATRATMLAPGSALNWATLGQAKLVSGASNQDALTDAHSAFGRAQELNPTDPGVVTALGVTERLQAFVSAKGEKPDNTKAVVLLEQAIALQPAYVQAHLELARLYASSLEEEKAFVAYGNARLAAPYDPRVAYEVAMYLREGKKTVEAIAELERAVKLAPNFVDAHLVLSDLYVFTGDYANAILHTEALLKLYPDSKELQARLESLKEKAAAPPKKKK